MWATISAIIDQFNRFWMHKIDQNKYCILFHSVYYDPFLAAAATADSNYRLQVNESLFVLLLIIVS